ncbi:MAG: hypothetical protein Q8P89_02010 [bacterium]|nr:hypothetical protein [bacterium]
MQIKELPFLSKRVLIILASFFLLLLLTVILSLRTLPAPLHPSGEPFSVSYDEEDKSYVVRLESPDSPETRENVSLWFQKKQIDSKNVKIRYLTLEDQVLQQKIIQMLPFDGPSFSAQYFPKTDIFLVQIKLTDKPFESSQEEALTWFRGNGVADFSKVKIRWLREGPGMSDEL